MDFFKCIIIFMNEDILKRIEKIEAYITYNEKKRSRMYNHLNLLNKKIGEVAYDLDSLETFIIENKKTKTTDIQ